MEQQKQQLTKKQYIQKLCTEDEKFKKGRLMLYILISAWAAVRLAYCIFEAVLNIRLSGTGAILSSVLSLALVAIVWWYITSGTVFAAFLPAAYSGYLIYNLVACKKFAFIFNKITYSDLLAFHDTNNLPIFHEDENLVYFQSLLLFIVCCFSIIICVTAALLPGSRYYGRKLKEFLFQSQNQNQQAAQGTRTVSLHHIDDDDPDYDTQVKEAMEALEAENEEQAEEYAETEENAEAEEQSEQQEESESKQDEL